ncbi:hypothetical protein EMIHUDRAFT_236875 [Emiliania huxleyi CCMP1516]|uniref:protein-serine/threonine phosphatase n=2 Tax=Emiliania huxleyi TaxID=2903 RepID=A0A0D3JRY2_EMIH1|nr:hypothetical protein EMIHUDRAFT_236875 [Emiliania huxleyi CCMP1516]EOD26267.1 hypothetical protein EMIHUDRAFT_236875 [Emiliania huxleyi CCMP1516]|eukprot:XP_005778696.1 hypothetical protein EMIHUDRAFT_236875 [Emiliania huxleyi CCMP1516]
MWGALGAEDTILIVDDSAAVHAPQLLVPRRYHFFDASAARDRNTDRSRGPPRGLLSRGKDASAERGQFWPTYFDESAERGQLAALQRALTAIHAAYFERTAERHYAWRLAVELGAAVSATATDAVTHVVAGAAGTDKARWAASRGKAVVGLEWLLECGYLWRREPEKAYPPPAVPSDAAPLGLSRDTLPPPRVG